MTFKPPFSDIRQRTVRLVASAYHKPPVLEPLASTFGARTHLEALESVTSGRQIAQRRGVPGISADALASGYGYSFVNAAFAYPRSTGNRFNPQTWGAWYSAYTSETAIEEVGYHLTRALKAAGEFYDNTTYYVELLADFDAQFCDLTNVSPPPTCLEPAPDVGYPAGQKLGGDLRQSGCNGIIYPSVRHHGGTCLVAFWPGLVQNFQRGKIWILTWAGNPKPSVGTLSDFS